MQEIIVDDAKSMLRVTKKDGPASLLKVTFLEGRLSYGEHLYRKYSLQCVTIISRTIPSHVLPLRAKYQRNTSSLLGKPFFWFPSTHGCQNERAGGR